MSTYTGMLIMKVSELPEDVGQTRLIEKSKRAAYVKDTSTQSQIPERTELQVDEGVTPKKAIGSMQVRFRCDPFTYSCNL